MTGRRGPRQGAVDTRSAILDSARASFAEVGYERTTIRAVAADAGVDPALVMHYFQTKQALFAASVEIPLSPGAIVSLVSGEDSPRGRALALTRVFFETWEDPQARQPLLGQLRGAFSSAIKPPIGEFFVDAIVRRIGALVGGDDAEIRVELAAAHLVGIAVLRYVVEMEPLASTSMADLVALTAPRIEGYLRDGDD